ncbi:hypothetical protein FOXG_07051 [Fusarium oxysporum f. sp. lycopersici 4287]|uniref:Uncharacterized protein n=2 Tax=Fusarium oxysporum TaxID=5507 RepID=A0A0J9V621_FUSO4|nr:hypothetical protein FOXG_07051 [Fusarium oxysporum f. sp. lycopersici 4287]KAJ9419664.1 hypothetical protein QL093DRAFT_2101665 [Fusarium oxysporum]KNB06286.1 hypothetical protein FOXG_07051 [Fusarium oxysporum f. sp. lycopersici 4287]
MPYAKGVLSKMLQTIAWWYERDKALWKCRYDRFLLHDIIVGLWQCGEDRFKETLACSTEKGYPRRESGFAAEDEVISQFLAEEVIVAGVRSPRLIEQLTMLTRSIWYKSMNVLSCR